MAAQEFSSPGEHMAGLSSGSTGDNKGSQVAYHNPNRPSARENSLMNGYNWSFDDEEDERLGSSARDYYERSTYDFMKDYMRYNSDLYNDARSWSEMMSNTAIQRQVADLKAAGLNPILATRLGGAAYQGVNVPYMSLSPSSALSAYTSYAANMYQTNVQSATAKEVAGIQTASNQFIANMNNMTEILNNRERLVNEKDITSIKVSADVLIEKLKELNSIELQKIGFQNEKELQELQNKLNIEYYKEISNFKYGQNVQGYNSAEGEFLRSSLFWNTASSLFMPATYMATTLMGMPGSTNPIGFTG